MLLWVGLPAVAAAAYPKSRHPVSIVKASIYVGQGRTSIRLACFAEDLELLQGVEPTAEGIYDSDEIREATQDHAEYLSERIILRDKDGEQLLATVTNISGVDIPEGGIKAGTLMEYALSFELEMVYDEPPKFLTVEQRMIAEGALLPSELGLVVKQSGVDQPLRDMQLKPGVRETIRFDWSMPALSPDVAKEEWDRWLEKQEEEALGIVSYGSLYSFIYITDREVRNEVLIPLATLASMMEFELEDPAFMTIAEQEVASKKITAFFSAGNPVTIDGVIVKPNFDRISFYGLDFRDFARQAEKRKVSMASGRVGVIMSYPAKTSPQTVTVEWTMFSDLIRTVNAVVFAHEEVEIKDFSSFLEHNVYQWEADPDRSLPEISEVHFEDPKYFAGPATFGLPVVTLGCLLAGLVSVVFAFRSYKWLAAGAVLAGVGMLLSGVGVVQLPRLDGSLDVDEAKAGCVFEQLHTNLFQAFDYTQQEEVYDALAASVHGPLLRKLYLQINNSLRIEQEGGAVARIEQVERLAGGRDWETVVEDGFRFRSKWNIVGTIEHWGHIHQRTNQYDAVFDVQIVDGDWKLTEMEILDQPQGIVKTRVRTL